MGEKHVEAIQKYRRKKKRFNYFLGLILFPITFLLQLNGYLLRFCRLEFFVFRSMFRLSTKKMHDKMESALVSYTPKPEDVFVCSYFKSGTNWTMQIVHQIAHRGQGEFEHIHDVIAWPDSPMKYSISLDDDFSSPTNLRAIKTHLIADKVPYNEKAKYVCVVRDPKDVFVSSYFFAHSILIGRLMPSVATWLNIYLSDDALHRSWAKFLHGYWLWRERKNVLFLTYEEMKDDLENAIQKIATLMEVDLSSEELERIKHLSSYKHMKSIDHKFSPGRLSPFGSGNTGMIRSGKKGSSSELITEQQQKRIDTYCKEELQKLGCDFPYEKYYS